MFARSIRNVILFCAVAMLGMASVCVAQFSSNIQGTVTDSTKAAVGQARVSLHSVATGIDSVTTTSASGFYRFTSIQPGSYTVSAAAQGFEAASVAVTVTTDETRGADIALQVAGSKVNVTVNSVATTLNPDETRVETTLSASDISALPLPNRDTQQLIALTPGITGHQNESPTNGYGSSIFAGNFNPDYHGNGLSTAGNLYILDDLPVNDAVNAGQALVLPNSDDIAEVALQAQTYSVQNGTAASIETAFTTKSGSNNFHGAVDYSYDSANVGSAKQPVTMVLAPFHQNIVLASLGGPIIKNKTFFFGSVEKQNAAIGGGSLVQNVLTPEFGAWALSAFPNSGAAKALTFAPADRVTPIAMSGKPAQTLASGLGSGIGSGCGTTQTVAADSTQSYNIPCNLPVYDNNAIFNQAQPFNGLQWNVRLDQSFRDDKDRIYVYYERIDQKLGDLAIRSALDAVSPSQNKYITGNYIHVFNDHLLNEAHFGNLRAIGGQQLNDPRVSSIPYSPIGLDTANGFAFEQWYGTMPFAAQFNKVHTYNFRDTVSYTWRSHSIRAGYQFQRGDVFQDSSQIYGRPFYPFYITDTISWASNAQSAGYSLYTIGGATGQYVPQFYGSTSIFNGLFVEDSWKARPNLALTLGIRYDDFGNPQRYGATGQPFAPIFLGSGSTFQQQVVNLSTHIAPRAFTNSQNPNFMPRVGFAYTPTKDKLLLLRGGIGLYENAPTPYQIANNLPTNPPNRISLNPYGQVPYGDFTTDYAPFGYNYGTFPVYGTDPYGNIYNKPTQQPGQVYPSNLNGYPANLKPEKILNYSFGLEQQFPDNLVFGISYVGSHGYDLIAGASGAGAGGGTGSDAGGNNDWNLVLGSKNRPLNSAGIAEWGQLNIGRNILSSSYNAMVVTARQTYKGLSYQANYNWSQALQDSPVAYDNGTAVYLWQTPSNPKQLHGPSTFDVTNSFSFGGGYTVPKLFGSGIKNEVLSNWRVSALAIAQSGTPFTVFNQTSDYAANNTGSGGQDGSSGIYGYPNYTGTQHGFKKSQAVAGVFGGSPTAGISLFPDPAGVGKTPVLGNQGPNSFRNLGYFTVNAGISKGFTFPIPHVAESARFFLRGEAVNLLNRTNYNGFVNDVNSTTTFGTVLSGTPAQQARYLQLGGRFEF